MDWRVKKEELEDISLSPLAARSAKSRGRPVSETPCPIRTEYERDHHRILYSVDFRRLRHKTQVFFNAKNDHICTRMEHVLYVAAIAQTIARTLNLNQDLAYAIALGHDLGHAPFGHTGERVLNECVKRHDARLGFEHETHSLRVVDRLATRRAAFDLDGARIPDGHMNMPDGRGIAGRMGGGGDGDGVDGVDGDGGDVGGDNGDNGVDGGGRATGRKGLNLTFEVRDGIACHCGEVYGEYTVEPDTKKTADRLYDADIRSQPPATLEGCVVRLVDKIAYVGRDIEDALRAGIIGVGDISRETLGELGFTNGQIINTLVSDLIENSCGRGVIALSAARGQALESLINENVRVIYKSDRIAEYERSMSNTMKGLFEGLLGALPRGVDALLRADERVLRIFAGYIKEQNYAPPDSPAQRVLDFVAGMTDSFALQCYEELYWL